VCGHWTETVEKERKKKRERRKRKKGRKKKESKKSVGGLNVDFFQGKLQDCCHK
jgi:hypothetical protein